MRGLVAGSDYLTLSAAHVGDRVWKVRLRPRGDAKHAVCVLVDLSTFRAHQSHDNGSSYDGATAALC